MRKVVVIQDSRGFNMSLCVQRSRPQESLLTRETSKKIRRQLLLYRIQITEHTLNAVRRIGTSDVVSIGLASPVDE